MSGDFVLERDGARLARAAKPRAFSHVFVLEYQRKAIHTAEEVRLDS